MQEIMKYPQLLGARLLIKGKIVIRNPIRTQTNL